MIDDRINFWLLLIPNVDKILLCHTPEKIIKGIEKTGLEFITVQSTKAVEIPKEFEVACLWMEDVDNIWLHYATKVLKAGGVYIVLPVRKRKNKIMDILNELGLRLNKKYIILPSKDEPRWLIPESSRTIMLRAFDIYQPYLRTAKLAKTLLTIGLKYGIGKSFWGRDQIWVIYNGKAENTDNLKHLISDYFGEKSIFLSVASGTISPYRKITVQIMNYQGKVLGFMKIGTTEPAKIQIEREVRALRELKSLNLKSVRIPKVLKVWDTNYGKLLLISPAGENFRPGPITMNSLHYTFLEELYSETVRYYLLQEHPAWLRLNKKVKETNWSEMKYDEEFIHEALCKIRRVLDLDGQKVPAVRIHGDFAPWNTKVNGTNLFIYDWESSERDGIPFYDVIYWNVQVMVLLKKKSASKIFRILEKKIQGNVMPKISEDLCRAYYLWCLVDIFIKRIGEIETNNKYLNKLFDISNIMLNKL